MTARKVAPVPAQLALAVDEDPSDLPAPVGTTVRLSGRRGEFRVDGMHGDGGRRSVRLLNGDNQFVFVRPGEVRLPRPKRVPKARRKKG